MKKIFFLLSLMLTMIFAMPIVCEATVATTTLAGEVSATGDPGAESTAGATENEDPSLREVLNDWLEKGDRTFAGQEWWLVVSTWVRANLDDILACVGGLTAFIGALLMLLKTNPKLRAYINSLGSSCKLWFEEIREGVKKLLEALGKEEQKQEQVGHSVDKLQQTVALLVDTLEDVIKLSGADESKKDIYIQKIEQAKKSIAEGGDRNEV